MFRASIFAVLLAAGAVHAEPFTDTPKAVFKGDASSSGWR